MQSAFCYHGNNGRCSEHDECKTTTPSPFPMHLDGQAAAKASLKLKMLLLKRLLNICLLTWMHKSTFPAASPGVVQLLLHKRQNPPCPCSLMSMYFLNIVCLVFMLEPSHTKYIGLLTCQRLKSAKGIQLRLHQAFLVSF